MRFEIARLESRSLVGGRVGGIDIGEGATPGARPCQFSAEEGGRFAGGCLVRQAPCRAYARSPRSLSHSGRAKVPLTRNACAPTFAVLVRRGLRPPRAACARRHPENHPLLALPVVASQLRLRAAHTSTSRNQSAER